MLLKPTHTCFDDALDFFGHLSDPIERAAHLVVHGICVLPDGSRIAHAWIERTDQDFVIEGALLGPERVYRAMPRATFDARWKIERCTRYTFDQALALNAAHDHFGPWDPEYAALCTPRSALGGLL
jgi:hypothetical protein